MKLGHFVTNPGTRDPTRARERVRDAARHLRRADGDGDRPRRLGAARDRAAAGEGGRVRGGLPDDQGLHERPRGDLERQGAAARRGRDPSREIPMYVAGYGPKALAVAGRVSDGVIIQLADPVIIEWIMAHRPRGRRGGRPRPGRARVHRRRAVEGHRRPRGRRATRCAGSRRWSRTTCMDLIERYGWDSDIPSELTDFVKARKFYDYKDHSRVGAAHGEFVTDEICDRFCVIGTRRRVHREAARARGGRRRPVQRLPDDERPGGDARGVRQRDHPAVRGRRAVDPAASPRAAVRSVNRTSGRGKTRVGPGGLPILPTRERSVVSAA